jgi:integrase
MAKRKKKRERRGRGEGSLYQRESDGKWVGSIVVGYNPETNKPRRKVVYGDTKEEAREKLLKLQQKSLQGLVQDSTMSLAIFSDFWLAGIKASVDKRSMDNYESVWKVAVLPILGHLPVANIKEFQITEAFRWMEEQGFSADRRHYAGKLLRRCLKKAVEMRFLADNPASRIPLPKLSPREIQPLTEEEVGQFLRVALKHRLAALWLLALDSGLRIGEIIALEWADVDLEQGLVTVRHSAQRNNDGSVRIKEPKTKASRRRVRITPQTVAGLKDWRKKVDRREHRVFPGRRKGGVGGKYLQHRGLERTFAKLLQKAGLRQVRFHDLRHTMATLALHKSKNIKAVSGRLGHGSVRITLQVYAHYLPVMEEELVAGLASILVPSPVATVMLQSPETSLESDAANPDSDGTCDVAE